MNVRLRFIFLMILVGLVAGNWEKIQNYYDRWRRSGQTAETVRGQDIEYYCPMHPNIVRAQPGNCPICGMPLAKRAKTGEKMLPAGVLAEVQLSPQKVHMGRIASAPVEYRLLSREIRTVGIVDYDETRVVHAAAHVKGRLEKLFVGFVGQAVRKGDPLFTIYSPDLLIAQNELISAKHALERPDTRTDADRALFAGAKQKLLLWGISDSEIDELLRRGGPEVSMTFHAHADGIVTAKAGLAGHYVNVGDAIYTIADLTRVWMQAKIFEDQISGVKIGTAVEVTSVAYPNEIFAGQITFIAYTVDPATRTVSARVEIDNSDLKLKPGMYANATIRVPVGRVMPAVASASAAQSGGSTQELASAYTTVAAALAKDQTDAAAIAHLGHEAHALADKSGGPVKSPAAEIARLAAEMSGKSLKDQRQVFQAVSTNAIELLRARPAEVRLYVAHCPMAKADWIQAAQRIANPYYGSQMLDCGEITGRIEPFDKQNEQFAEGYFCPIYPDHLYDQPRECPMDKFPTKFVRIEKVLAVPTSAVINTGARTVVYRDAGAGTYDMLAVKLGPRAGEFFPVLDGLKPGERVATAGAFVVDAENRLNPSAAAQYFGASGGESHHGAHGGHGGRRD